MRYGWRKSCCHSSYQPVGLKTISLAPPVQPAPRRGMALVYPKSERRILFLIVEITIAIVFASVLHASPKKESFQPPSKLENRLIYSVDQPGQLYLVRNGHRHLIVDFSWVRSNGYGWNQLQAVSKTEFDALPSGEEIRPTPAASLEGSTIEAQNQPVRFYVRGGMKHWIPDPNWIQGHKNLATRITIVSPETVNSIPAGAPYSEPLQRRIGLTAAIAVFVFCFLVLVCRSPSPLKQLTALVTDFCHKDYRFRVVLLLLLIACVLLRSVHLLIHPRFWAEEGVIWFQYALEHNPWSTLVFVYNLSGYMNLAANVAAVLSGTAARIGHILRAPLASTIVALIIQTIPLIILCLGNSRIINSRWKLIVAGVIFLTLPSATPEIWLNSINSMSFAGLITLLLLFEENTNWRPGVRWTVRVLLVLCGLTGIYAVALAPFFLAYYFYRRSREHAVQGLILLAVGVVQAATVVYFKLHGGLPMRGEPVATLASINVLYYHVTVPVVGQELARPIFRFFGMEDAWWVANSYPHWPDESTLLAGWASAILLIVILAWLCRRKCSCDKLLLAGIFVLYAALTSIGALHGIAAARYAFLPAMAMLMLVLNNVEASGYGVKELVCSAAIAMAVSVGVIHFYHMEMFSGPSWHDEIVKWEKDENYGMRVWPGGWGPPIHYDQPKQ